MFARLLASVVVRLVDILIRADYCTEMRLMCTTQRTLRACKVRRVCVRGLVDCSGAEHA